MTQNLELLDVFLDCFDFCDADLKYRLVCKQFLNAYDNKINLHFIVNPLLARCSHYINAKHWMEFHQLDMKHVLVQRIACWQIYLNPWSYMESSFHHCPFKQDIEIFEITYLVIYLNIIHQIDNPENEECWVDVTKHSTDNIYAYFTGRKDIFSMIIKNLRLFGVKYNLIEYLNMCLTKQQVKDIKCLISKTRGRPGDAHFFEY